MATIIIGASNLSFTIKPGAVVSQAEDGSATATLTYVDTYANVTQNLPAPLQSHPVFPALLMYTFAIRRIEGDMGEVDCMYKGILTSDPAAYTVYEYRETTNSDPIEANPMFSYPVDSPPVTPEEQNAIAKALDSFTPYSGTTQGNILYKGKLLGIDSYLRVGGTFTASYVQAEIPPIPNDLGYIGDPPSPAPTPTAVGANYLHSGFSWRKQGGLVFVQDSYEQSAQGGWYPPLYTLPA